MAPPLPTIRTLLTPLATLGLLMLSACSGNGEPPPFEPPPPPPPEAEEEERGTWTFRASLPEPIQEFHGVVLNGRIYVAGGIVDGDDTSSRTYRYDPATDSWERRADLPGPRHHMPMVVAADSLYAIGGFGPTGFEAQRNLWVYLEDEDEWQFRSGPSIPRGASAAAALDGRIYLVGGYTLDSQLVSEVDVYEPATGTWSRAAPLPTPLDHLAAVALGEQLYVVAGRTIAMGTISDLVQRYDPAEDAWDEVARLPAQTAGHGVAVLDGRIHVVGGEGFPGPSFDYHFVYDPTEEGWSILPSLPTGRHGMAVAEVEGLLFTIGGGPLAGFSQSDLVEVFEPAPDE